MPISRRFAATPAATMLPLRVMLFADFALFDAATLRFMISPTPPSPAMILFLKRHFIYV